MTVLLLFNSIASFAQNGKAVIIGEDTCMCYNKAELTHITKRVVQAKECDTLLNLCERDLAISDSIISLQNQKISSYQIIIDNQETIITGKEGDILQLKDLINLSDKKLKWLKLGWVTSSVVLMGLLSYFIIH